MIKTLTRHYRNQVGVELDELERLAQFVIMTKSTETYLVKRNVHHQY